MYVCPNDLMKLDKEKMKEYIKKTLIMKRTEMAGLIWKEEL
jgi:hypothetical protein